MNSHAKGLLSQIRPYIIQEIQNGLVEDFKKNFQQQHNRPPNDAEINELIVALISSDLVRNEADIFVDDLIWSFNRKPVIIFILKEVGLAILFAVVCCSYILLYLNEKLGKEIVPKNVLLNSPGLIVCALVIIVIFATMINIAINKNK